MFKETLLQRKVLKDKGSHWELRCNIRTGLLMAVNLNAGQLLKKSPYEQDIIVSKTEAAELKGKFQEKQICLTDSDIVMKSLRDTQKLVSVNIMEVNSDVFTHHGADSFGKDEAFVLNIMRNKGLLSTSARHGLSSKNEADIVDEEMGEQFEIIYEFKTSLSKNKMKPDFLYNPEIQIIQLVDNPFIHTSRALEKKFNKEYTNQFRSNLVILTFGNNKAVISMLEALSQKLMKQKNSHVSFASIYIISMDFISEKAIFAKISPNAPLESEQFLCKNEELGFIKLTPIEFAAMKDDNKYLMICNDIFNGIHRCRYDSGAEFRKWVKEIRMSGI